MFIESLGFIGFIAFVALLGLIFGILAMLCYCMVEIREGFMRVIRRAFGLENRVNRPPK